MLPYHLVQLAYAALGGGLAVGLWWGSGRALRGISSVGWRFVACLAASLGSALLGYVLLVNVLGRDIAVGFAAIASAFYAGGLALPLLALAAGLRRGGLSLPARALDLGLPALVLATALWALLGEPDRVQVRHEVVPLAQWPADAPALRIVHLSDLQTVGANDRERRVVELVNALDADLVVLTGDYLSGPFFDTAPALAAAREFVGGLRACLGVLAVGGHSESHPWRLRIFEGTGVRYLTNENAVFELGDGRRLDVLGLDPRGEDLRPLDALRAPGEARIVASHLPDLTVELSGRDVDLHLAGHTHGGQVAIPGIGAPWTLSALPRRLARGLHRFGDHWLDVSAGIGMEGNHAPRIRLFCPPEISVLELRGAGAPVGKVDG